MKKAIAVILVFLLVFSSVACSSSEVVQEEVRMALDEDFYLKVGFIFSGDKNDAYANAHYEAAMKMKEQLGLTDEQIIIKWNVTSTEKAYHAATDLADQFCDIVFSNSYGHEDYMIRAAMEYPEVQFCHLGGYQASSCELDNVHNFYADVYEARYVSGIVAGMKLNEMIKQKKIKPDEAKMGYVGSFTYAEVISGYTAFYLGAKSVCDSVTMDVTYTGYWAGKKADREATEMMIENGCVLMSHHTDTMSIADVCEEAGVPFVGAHMPMTEQAPTCALTSVFVDWNSYITMAVKSVMDGTEIPVDWSEGYKKGVVGITELNSACVAKGTEEAVEKAEDALKNGKLKVFDTSTWMVHGKTVTSTKGEELKDRFYGLEYIKDGTFQECTLASVPAFLFRIDGITELNEAIY
ncbi:MAG: BMP family ABC transporter substrate-binding protein [Ruminococcaceae bacterium]|nr:BMP family ABC transporter substrate-binding protein [Oscillospiraceae bacterium]